ncbi:ethylene-responsive nuclear protein / ethylene-regulated nuclear protein (ERT2) [Wolffia australiana]
MRSGKSKDKRRAVSWLRRSDGDMPAPPADDDDSVSRPKRPPRRRRSNPPSVENAGFSTMASLAAVIMEASRPPEQKIIDSPPTETFETEQRILEPLHREDGPSQSPKKEEEEEVELEEEEDDSEKRPVENGKRRWVLVLTRVFILAVVLMVGSKKIALGVSVSAVAALLLEAVFKRLLPVRATSEKSEIVETESVQLVESGLGFNEGEDVADEPDNGSEWSWTGGPPSEVRSPEVVQTKEEEREGEEEEEKRLEKPRKSRGRAKRLLKKLVRKSSVASSNDS